MTEVERKQYVVERLKVVANSLRALADRVDKQSWRAELAENSPNSLPLSSVVEEIVHNIMWAIPNLQLERIMFKAMEPLDE